MKIGCAAAVALLSLNVGCADELSDEAFGVVDLAPYYADGAAGTNPAGGLPRTLAPRIGYSQGASVELYDFGLVPFDRVGTTTTPATAAVNPMYVFFDAAGNPMLARPVRSERTGVWHLPGGNPTLSPNAGAAADRARPYSLRQRATIVDARRGTSAHQRPVIDVGPDELNTRYTGLWEIVEVTAGGYVPDTIKSADTLQEAIDDGKVRTRATGKVINCPLVDERTEVVASLGSRASPQPLIEVWYRRKRGTCLLADGWETIAKDGELIAANMDAARLQTFDVMQTTVQVGGETQQHLRVPVARLFVPAVTVTVPDAGSAELRYFNNQIVEERPRRSEADPTGYTPIRWLWDVTPPLDPMTMRYVPGTLKTIDGVDMRNLRARTGGPWVRNVSSAGPVPTCGEKDAAGMCTDAGACEALGLSCNTATCQCDLPEVGWGELCAPGFQRCRTAPADAAEAAYAPNGFVCHPREPRGFCVPRCDATAMDMAPEANLDSRCGNQPGFVCATPGEASNRLDDRKESVCVRTCRTTEPQAQSVCAMPPAFAQDSPAQRCQSQRQVTSCNFDDTLYPF